jgi:hypothetical protein
MDEYLQEIFDDSFENSYAYFMLRRREDSSFTRDSLRGLLDSLYVRQGNNWDGRGQAKEMSLSGMISAGELVLEQWDSTLPG